MRSKIMGTIEAFMSADHSRLDALLNDAVANEDVDAATYEQFRAGLLRHIGMEEKILLPFAKQKRGGEPLAIARALRADHGTIAKLLVPTPTRALCEELRRELVRHNALEEGEQGLYAICDALAGSDSELVVSSLRAAPAVPTAKHYDGPLLKRAR